jgi:hypothetical protein
LRRLLKLCFCVAVAHADPLIWVSVNRFERH